MRLRESLSLTPRGRTEALPLGESGPKGRMRVVPTTQLKMEREKVMLSKMNTALKRMQQLREDGCVITSAALLDQILPRRPKIP